MFKKSYLVFLIGIILFVSLGYADTKPANGVYHWNLTGLTDIWSGKLLTNNGAVSVNDYPTYKISGTSSPNSYDFEWDEVDYMTTTDAKELKGCTAGSCAYTFNTWIKFESFSVIQYIFMMDSSGGAPFWRLQLYYDQTITLGDTVSVTTKPIFGNWTTNKWYMITATCNESTNTAKIYINATEWGTGTATNCQNDFDVGANIMYYSRQSNVAQRGIDGYMDEISWYNVSLSPALISNLYNYGTITAPTPPAPSGSNTSVNKINMTWYPETFDDIDCMFNVTDNSSTFKVVNVTVSWYNSTDGTTYAKRNTYNYKYVNVTHNLLYTTGVGTGSVPANTFSNYSYWKCAINATTTAGTIWANSTARRVNPLENLTIFGPANNTISRFQFNASYAVTDDNGGLNCTLYVWNSSSPYCYQETANISTSCGGLNTGKYSDMGVWNDGIWFGFAIADIYKYVNYTVPNNALYTNSLLQWQDSLAASNIYNSTFNSTLCDYPNLQLKITAFFHEKQQCKKNGIWVDVSIFNTGDRFFEEGIFWNMRYQSITHPTTRVKSYSNYTLPSDGVYDWYMSCIGNGATSPITSPTYTYTYDTVVPTYSSYQSDNTSTYPEIGDTFSMNATVYDLNNVSTCKLAMNDTGTWANKSTYTVNAQTDKLEMSYVIQDYSTANMSRISWKVWCNDTAGNQGYSDTKTFHVIDVTYPVITLPATGNNWKTDNKSVIGNTFHNMTFNVTFIDYNLFQAYVNVSCDINDTIYFWELVDINTTTINKADEVDISLMQPQRCLIQFANADDHTAQLIPKYKIEKLDKGMKYTTDDDINIEVKSDDADYDNMKTTKLKDRYTFEFGYDDKSLERTYIITSDKKLYPRDHTQYPGHFVAWDANKRTGEWIDFADETDSTEVVEKIRISDYEYKVIIKPKISEEELQDPEPIEGINILGWQITPDITDKDKILKERYGIEKIKFKSLGGVLQTYLTYTFYIGMDVYVNATNLYDNSLIRDEYRANATWVNAYPVINRSVLVTTGTNVWQNLSNGTYTLTFRPTVAHYFPVTQLKDIQNTGSNHTFYTSQSAATFYVRSVVTNALLTGFNMTITNKDTLRTDGVNNSATSSYYRELNATNYNVTVKKTGYYDEHLDFTQAYLDNNTYTLYLGQQNTFLLYDEKTLGVFNVSGADLIQFILFCPNSTSTTVITSNTTTLPLTCQYNKFKFILDYSGTSYYRTFILFPAPAANVSIYLIDLTTTSSIYNTFYMDDLLNQYINASIYLYKLINDENVQITADYVDIENKIGAYLIANHEYTVEVHSASMPVKALGSYGADISGAKTIRMYDTNADMLQGSSYYNNLFYYLGVRNISGTPYAFANFRDYADNTSNIIWRLYLGNASGTLLYTYATASNNFEAIYNISSYQNDTLFSTLTFTRFDMSTHTIGAFIQIGQAFFGLVHDVTDLLGEELVQWIIIIFLSVIALSATIKTANVVAIAVIGVAAIFAAFGWMTVASSALAIAALIAILSMLKKGDT